MVYGGGIFARIVGRGAFFGWRQMLFGTRYTQFYREVVYLMG